MNKTRTYYTVKNTIYGYITSTLTLVIGFISRYIFIKYLGMSFLGVNGLFTNILGVLSFAELGFGTAINFSLYKPVAQQDRDIIKSLMHFYKRVYLAISVIVLLIGLLIIPFLGYLIKDPGNIGSLNAIRGYFLIFLLNTVSSYFVSYKYSLANAEQKTYIQTNFETITSIAISVAQIISIVVYKNFILYLVVGLIANLILKTIVGFWLDKKYPILREEDSKSIDQQTLGDIKKNVKGLVFHRLGEISVYQTDNIIVSSFISLEVVGKISNYTMIIDAISKFTNAMFNSVIASFGNLIVLEGNEKKYNVFCKYRFMGFWVYGFCSIMLYTLSTPFIQIIFGKDLNIDELSVALICLDFYLRGHRICLNNIKTAGGVFYQDRYVAFMQAGVNIIVSIIGVKLIGLPGVYIGTVLQGLLANIIKPYFVYRDILEKSVFKYYQKGFLYLLYYVIAAFCCKLVRINFFPQLTFLSLIFLALICCIVINLLFWLGCRKMNEYTELKGFIKDKLININLISKK